MDEPVLIEARGVTRRFESEGSLVDVLKGVDLSIHRGEMVAVVGRSGAGKSTFLHVLGTLDLPTSGSVVYDGRDITSFGPARLANFRNRHIGFVFQFHHLLPEFTSEENVAMPGLVGGVARRETFERANALLDQVGLSHRRHHRPSELSGGEQQRVALARALVMDPPLVLADEPTGNLDSTTSDSIHDLMFEINETKRTTFMVVTHSRELASRLGRVVTMQDGKVLHSEPNGSGDVSS